jgi:hypothetical protein
MSDIVYLYPKTSCKCEAESTVCTPAQGKPTNRAIFGCKEPDCFDATGRIAFAHDIEPTNSHGWSEINSAVYSNKKAPNFGKIPCKTGCREETYMAYDPRLYSPTHNTYLPLDSVPITGNVNLSEIYAIDPNYGVGAKPYSEIDDGQILYYSDKSIARPFFSPVFGQRANVISTLYRDPMGSIKPEYTRVPDTINPTVETPAQYEDCLSFVQDTQASREDLMSYQMARRNREKWGARYNL